MSPTPTAPLPSGLIINALAAKSVHVDLKSECSKEFKKQPKVENGTIVQTVGPVGSIYHLKIEPKWDQGKGAKVEFAKCFTIRMTNIDLSSVM